MEKKKVVSEIRSWGTIIIIALLLKSTLFGVYMVPTGSMENTILPGDFLVGNLLSYGMRTPDWIGIPYTDKGFNIPYLQLPKFKEPTPGEVIIFKYPHDTHHKYVKRCLAGPGDNLEIVNREVFVNGEIVPISDNGKFIGQLLGEEYTQHDLFLPNNGNKDNFKKISIPKEGDVFKIDENTDWRYLLPVIIYDGHRATLNSSDIEYEFTTIDPNDLYRRKGEPFVYDDYFPSGKLLNPWMSSINELDFQFLQIDGIPVSEMKTYTVKQDYYWAMGDNRDNSLDSRFWGFVPENYIIGEALIVIFSVNLNTWLPRLKRTLKIVS